VKPPVGTAVSPLGEERASSFPHHPLRIIQECSMTTRLLAARAAVAVAVLAATVSLFVTALDAAG
jgi:hypothetical protein